MPEKDGADDKKKMKNEEVVDYLKDTGRYKRSPDTKDATSYPPSEEVKKTQIVNTGPSAYELIKKKYKGQIMNVGKKGKKKVQDEFDLTQVAEAFGGYIVEAPTKKPSYAYSRELGPQGRYQTKNIVKRALKAFPPEGQKVGDDADAEVEKRIIDAMQDKKAAQIAGRDALQDTIEKKPAPKKSTATRANYPKTRAELEAKRKEYEIDRQGKTTDAGVEKYARRTKQSNLPLSQDELDTARKRMVGTGEKGTDVGKYGGRLGRKRNKNMPSLDQVKADIDAKEKAKADRKDYKKLFTSMKPPKSETKPETESKPKVTGGENIRPTDVTIQPTIPGLESDASKEKQTTTRGRPKGSTKTQAELDAARSRRATKRREAQERGGQQTIDFDKATLPDNVRVGTTSGDLIQDRPVMKKGKPVIDPKTQQPKTRPTEITPAGRVKPIGTLGRRAERAQRQSAIGALGGLLAKSAVPATAGLEAAERLRKGEKGVALSAVQAMDIPYLSKAAGIINAIQTYRRGQRAAANQQAMVDAATGGGGGGRKGPRITSSGGEFDREGPKPTKGGDGLAAVGGDAPETDTVTSRILATQLPNIGKRLRQGAGSVPRGLRGGTVGRRSAGGFTAT